MRTINNINKDWLFTKNNQAIPTSLPKDWESVDLPYTWNGKDGQDGGNDYYRGTCYFAKELPISSFEENKVHYIQFDGVNSSCDVYFNGEKLFSHDGGYSTFRVPLKDIKESNLLVVAVDNSVNDRVYPQTADFTFYGGIYRDVSILSVEKNHFELDYYGTPGIKVTPSINGSNANVNIEAYANGTIQFNIIDKKKIIATQTITGNNPSVDLTINNVHLWNGTIDPYLYTAEAILLDGENEIDKVSTRFGCRTFKIDPNKGFILNGKEYPLRGVCRHQDRPEIGNALLYEHHKEDIDLICEVGANTIRLAHYQHAQAFYDLCDEKGLVIWAEIPYISRHMPNGLDNTISQMKELIIQNYNHPCIVTWGLSNEITLNGASDESMVNNHRILNDLVHKLDKTRLTTMAVVTMCDPSSEYVQIPDVVSFNHYFGWYGGTTSMNGEWFDKFHKDYPNIAVGLSEYGCEALNWHTSTPTQGDYTEEYQAYYHEELIKQISTRQYIWATHLWNMFDFAADARAEGGENGMNHKGLVTFDRKYKKDAFYAYKAWWSKEPVLHICSKRYIDRVEDKTKVTIYSNQDEVELFANGVSVGKQSKGEYPFFYFEVNNEGETTLLAKAGDLEDTATIRKVDKMNESYVMKEEGAVINWFEIEAPAGYLSVNDTVGEVWSTFRGKFTLLKLALSLKKALSSTESNQDSKNKKGKKKMEIMGMPVTMNSLKSMMKIAAGFPIKRVFSMIGSKIPKETILALNKKLNKIRKPKSKS